MDKTPFDNIWQKWLEKVLLPADIAVHIERYYPLLEEILKAREILYKDKKTLRILETGCGTAIISYLLAEKKDVEIYGVDISEKSIALAQKMGIYFKGKVNLGVGDVNHLEFENDYFDIIFSQGLLEHFKNPIPAMKEQIRVLRKNGILIVDVPQKYNLYTYRKHKKMKKGIWPWGWETEYSFRQLRRLGESVGLKVLSIKGYGYGERMERITRLIPKKIWIYIRDNIGYLFLNSIIATFIKCKSN